MLCVLLLLCGLCSVTCSFAPMHKHVHCDIIFSIHSQKTLHEIASHLHLVPPLSQCPSPLDRNLLLAVLVARHERRQSQLDELNDTPLYPTEQVLWDENVVPSDYYNGESKGTKME